MRAHRIRKTACRFVPGVQMRRTHQPGAANPYGASLYVDGQWFGSFVGRTRREAQGRAVNYAMEAGLCTMQRRHR